MCSRPRSGQCLTPRRRARLQTCSSSQRRAVGNRQTRFDFCRCRRSRQPSPLARQTQKCMDRGRPALWPHSSERCAHHRRAGLRKKPGGTRHCRGMELRSRPPRCRRLSTTNSLAKAKKRLQRALDLAQKLSPVVLWIDEIEKAFASAGSAGDADAGLSQRLLAALLTWMQEREPGVFLAATSNNITILPPEDAPQGPLRRDLLCRSSRGFRSPRSVLSPSQEARSRFRFLRSLCTRRGDRRIQRRRELNKSLPPPFIPLSIKNSSSPPQSFSPKSIRLARLVSRAPKKSPRFANGPPRVPFRPPDPFRLFRKVRLHPSTALKKRPGVRVAGPSSIVFFSRYFFCSNDKGKSNTRFPTGTRIDQLPRVRVPLEPHQSRRLLSWVEFRVLQGDCLQVRSRRGAR